MIKKDYIKCQNCNCEEDDLVFNEELALWICEDCNTGVLITLEKTLDKGVGYAKIKVVE